MRSSEISFKAPAAGGESMTGIERSPEAGSGREETAGRETKRTADAQQEETSGRKTKKRHKAARRIGVIAAAAAVLLCMETVARHCFDTVHNADYYNYDLKRIEETGENVGMVIAGASQVYHGCDTELLAYEFGYDNVIAAGTSYQSADGSYYILNNIIDRFDPEYVVVSAAWDILLPGGANNLNRSRLIVGDCISFPERVDYILKCAPAGQWLNLSYLYRFGGTVESLQQLEDNYIQKKKVASGEQRDDSSKSSYYEKNGYVIFKYGKKQGTIGAENLSFDISKVMQHNLDYYNKIADMCRERGKKLIWITMPTSMAEIYSIDGYQTCVDYMTAFFKSTGYPYLNFSMLRNREEIFPDTVFTDHVHLDQKGAEIFSKIFADMVKSLENGDDVSDMFYSSVDEMKNDVHRIVASRLTIKVNDDGTCDASIQSRQNDDIIPQYRLSKVQDDGSAQIISDWQNETEVKIPAGVLTKGDNVKLEVRQEGREKVDAYWTAKVS